MKRLLKKADGEFTYKAVSPVIVKYTGFEQGEVDKYELSKGSTPQEIAEINEAIKNDLSDEGSEGLAFYLKNDNRYTNLSEAVTAINVAVDNAGATTIIKTTRELSPDEIEQLKNYLTGQYADGWGEGFEQRPFTSYKENFQVDAEYDEEDGYSEDRYETITDTVEVTAHFWNPDNFSITITKE